MATLHNDKLIIKYDFQRPAHGVNPVGVNKTKLPVGCDEYAKRVEIVLKNV